MGVFEQKMKIYFQFHRTANHRGTVKMVNKLTSHFFAASRLHQRDMQKLLISDMIQLQFLKEFQVLELNTSFCLNTGREHAFPPKMAPTQCWILD